MKTKLTLTILITIISFNLNAQITFQKNYGDTIYEWGNAVKQCFDGGYISTGYIVPTIGQWNIYLIKTDSIGDTLWTRRYGGDDMVGFDVIQTKDSNFVLCGYKNSSGGGQMKKIDQSGTTLWTQYYTGWIQAVQETYDGNLIGGGINLYKTNPSGSFIWSKPTVGQIMYLIQTTDSNYVTLGFSGTTIYLRKVDTAGTTMWTKSVSGSIQNTSNNCLAQTSDGGFIYTGKHSSGSGALLVKTDMNGDTLWTKVFSVMEYATSVVQTNDGGYAIGGKTILDEMILLKTTNTGNIQWSNIFVAGTFNEAKSLQKASDGGFILSGGTYSSSSVNKDNLFLVKTDSLGNCINTSIAIYNSQKNNPLQLFPNPFSSQTNLHTDNFLKNATLIIDNCFGQTVKQINNISDQTIILNRDNLPSGLYFIRLTQDNKVIGTEKLIITD